MTHMDDRGTSGKKPKPRFSVKNRSKLNRKWNSRTVTALTICAQKLAAVSSLLRQMYVADFQIFVNLAIDLAIMSENKSEN